MKSWQLLANGALALTEQPIPTPQANEVLVKIHAIGLNNLDLQLCNGDLEPIHLPPFSPFTPGIEASGEVVALGSHVQFRQIGEQVSLHYHQNCGQCDWCSSGKENICPNALKRGQNAQGFWQEYVSLPEGFALPFTTNLDYQTAAALSVTGATAWHMLVEKANVKPGETVLIVGASSGIGLAAKELCWALGATCILAARGTKLQHLQEEGDYLCIDLEAENWSHRLAEIGGVEVVYEAIGAKTLSQSLNALKIGGRLILGGYASGVQTQINLAPFIAKEISLIGSSAWTRKDLKSILKLAENGSILPSIHQIYPFSQLPEGLAQLKSGTTLGKVIIEL